MSIQKAIGSGAVVQLPATPIGQNLEPNQATVLIQVTGELKIMPGFTPIFLANGMTIGMTRKEV